MKLEEVQIVLKAQCKIRSEEGYLKPSITIEMKMNKIILLTVFKGYRETVLSQYSIRITISIFTALNGYLAKDSLYYN